MEEDGGRERTTGDTKRKAFFNPRSFGNGEDGKSLIPSVLLMLSSDLGSCKIN